MQHVDFHLDFWQPTHALFPGQRFWRDGTPEEAVAIIDRRINLFSEKGHVIPDDARESLLDAARKGVDEWRTGWPYLDRHPDR